MKCRLRQWIHLLVLEKAEEPEIKFSTSAGSLKTRDRSRKSIYFCFIDYAKAFECVDHNKLWEILRETGLPDHQTCLLRNLYAGQEATVRTGHGKADRFQIGKGVRQGYCYSAFKKKKKKDILTYVTSMNLDSVMLSEINQIHKTNTD